MIKPEIIYGLPFDYGGLGDYWAYTNYFLKLSQDSNDTAYIKCNDYSTKIIKQCRNFIQSTGSIMFTDMPITKIIFWRAAYRNMLPAIKTWNPIGSKLAFQFDGICDGNLKNPSSEEINFFLKKTKILGLQAINIGNKQPLAYCIETMAKSECLVACPSGMSVIARSINTPVCLIYKNLTQTAIENLYQLQYNYSKRIWLFKTFEEMFAYWDTLNNAPPEPSLQNDYCNSGWRPKVEPLGLLLDKNILRIENCAKIPLY